MITLLNDKVEDKVKFLASALLYAGMHGNAPWILGTCVQLQITQLDLIEKNDKEVVQFTATVWGPSGNKYGTISKDFLAKDVRQAWVGLDANHPKKRIAAYLAGCAKEQLDALYIHVEQARWGTMHTLLAKIREENGPLLGIPHPSRVRPSGAYPVYIRDGRFVCDCTDSISNRTGIICNHIKWMLISGEDKLVFNYASMRRNQVQKLEVPIGLGEYWLPVQMERAVDEDSNKETPFIIVTSPLQKKLHVLIGLPTELSDVVSVIHEDEGVLAYIRFIEELIMSTPMFNEVENEPADQFMTMLSCKKIHRQAAMDRNRSKCQIRNPYRQAWVVASIASVMDDEVCLACKSSAVPDTPDFD